MLFLQLWPFYYSEHGSHLFDWYAGGFPHLVFAEEEIRSRVLVENPQPHSDYIWSEYQTLNRITLDDLGAALFAAGFRVAQAELISNLTSLPEAVASQPLSRLLISGVKLMAYPR